MHPREGVSKEESSYTLGKPPIGRAREDLQNFRGECNSKGSEDKREKIHHRNHYRTALSSTEATCTPLPTADSAGRVSGSGVGVRSHREDQDGLL